MNINKKLVYKKKNSKMYLPDNNGISHSKTSKNEISTDIPMDKNVLYTHNHKSSNFNSNMAKDFKLKFDNNFEEEISPKKSKIKLVKLIEPIKDKDYNKSKSKEKINMKNFKSKDSSKKTLQFVSNKSIFNFGSDHDIHDIDNKSRNNINNLMSNKRLSNFKMTHDNNINKNMFNFRDLELKQQNEKNNFNDIHKAIEKLNLNQYKKAETLKTNNNNNFPFTPLAKSNYNNVMSKKDLDEFIKNINTTQKRKSNLIINALKQEKLQNNIMDHMKTELLNEQLRNKRFEYEKKQSVIDLMKKKKLLKKSNSIYDNDDNEDKKTTIKNNQILVNINSLSKNQKNKENITNDTNNLDEGKKSFHLFLKDMNINRESIKNPNQINQIDLKKIKNYRQSEVKNDNDISSKDSPTNKINTNSIFSNLIDGTSKTVANKSKFKEIFKNIGKKKELSKQENTNGTNQAEETDLFKLIKAENNEKGGSK